MDETTTSAGDIHALGRREMLKRGAFVVGATAFWSTPLVQTLGMRSAAAAVGTKDDDSDLCPVVGPNGSGQPSDLVFRYSSRSCDDSNNAQKTELEAGISTDWSCTGETPGPGPVCIALSRPGSPTIYVTVDEGELLHVPGKAGSRQDYVITDCQDRQQIFSFHTSCSQPLDFGETFASLELVGGTDADTNEPAGVSPTNATPMTTTACLPLECP